MLIAFFIISPFSTASADQEDFHAGYDAGYDVGFADGLSMGGGGGSTESGKHNHELDLWIFENPDRDAKKVQFHPFSRGSGNHWLPSPDNWRVKQRNDGSILLTPILPNQDPQ